MLWKTIRLMYRMPGHRRRVWEGYQVWRRAQRLGGAVLEVSSGLVYRASSR